MSKASTEPVAKSKHRPGDPGRAVQTAIAEFRSNPDNPFLVSFPRTGSHWLRMMMELHFDRPMLVRSFFNFNHENYMLLHTHDMNLTERSNNVIYLYRNPVDTVYSQIKYHKQDCRDRHFVTLWAQHYAVHLVHWLFNERFTTKKTIITYEGLKADLESEFQKVCQHFGLPFSAEKLKSACETITREKVKEKTSVYDTQVMNTESDYEVERDWFSQHQAELVWETLKSVSKLTQGDENKLANLF